MVQGLRRQVFRGGVAWVAAPWQEKSKQVAAHTSEGEETAGGGGWSSAHFLLFAFPFSPGPQPMQRTRTDLALWLISAKCLLHRCCPRHFLTQSR